MLPALVWVDPPHPASLPIASLMADCQVDRVRRSGPGGQHRNKVETGIVLIHQPTGARVEASERRSQKENLLKAQFRLRIALALEVRSACVGEYQPSELWRRRCPQGKIVCNSEHDDFPALLAEALDVIARYGFDVKSAALTLGCSTSQLVKLLQHEPRAISRVNGHRQERSLPALQ